MSNSQTKLHFKICDTAADGSNYENVFHFQGNVKQSSRRGGGEMAEWSVSSAGKPRAS
jgi:hypothetical protein